jgi:hypothetical protein
MRQEFQRVLQNTEIASARHDAMRYQIQSRPAFGRIYREED